MTLQSKTRTHAAGAPQGATTLGETEIKDDIPRSIVAKASKVLCTVAFFSFSNIFFAKVGPQVGELVRDVRKLMGPYTANNLREKR